MNGAVPNDELLAVLRQFASDRDVDPTRIVPEAALSDIGIDSLQAIDLIFEFEERYGITIRVEDFRATTVSEALDFVGRFLMDHVQSAPTRT